MKKIIHGELYSSDFSSLNKLVTDWSSARRFAFCRFQKDKSTLEECYIKTRMKYTTLNTRQIDDAVKSAQGLYTVMKNKKVVFGGKKNQDKLVKKEISNQVWKDNRDNQIYARGDKTGKGNPNIRLLNKNGDFYLRITVGTRKFEEYKLFIPTKFEERLLSLFGSDKFYNVRLLKKDKQHYRVIIDYEVESPKTVVDFSNGIIGVDNPWKSVSVREKCMKTSLDRYGSFFPYTDTSIEVALQDALRKENIEFETQKPIRVCNVFTTSDIFIKPNICIFADGNYWHNYPDGTERDKQVNIALEKNDYKVLRFWEKDINRDIKRCVNEVRKALI